MHRPQPTWPAISMAIWAVLFGGLNLYWTIGGRWLTDRLGQSLQDGIAENDQQLMLANTAGGIGKLMLGAIAIVSILPLAQRPPRLLLSLALIVPAVGMFFYGLLNWSIATAALLGIIETPASVGEDALPWYVGLWEPIWMLGGVLLALTWWAWRKSDRRKWKSS